VKYISNYGGFSVQAQITAVDIDPVMENVAYSWFGLPRGKRIESVVEDGITYLTEASANGEKSRHLNTLAIGQKMIRALF